MDFDRRLVPILAQDTQGRTAWRLSHRQQIGHICFHPFLLAVPGSTLAPFPHPAHRTGRVEFPRIRLYGQDLTHQLERRDDSGKNDAVDFGRVGRRTFND